MKIVHLSNSDAHGGAARAAYRLHDALRRQGHESAMLVLHRLTHDPDVTAFQPEKLRGLAHVRRRLRKRRIKADFARYARSRPPGLWHFTDDRTEHRDALARQLPKCDLLNLHAVAGFVDHEHFFRHLPQGLPVVWRLPELSPFTGGCHQDGGCGRFTRQCGACPQLGSTNPHDLSHQIWLRKARSFRHLAGRLHLVAPSNWTAAQARRSSLLNGHPVCVIPNGLDTDEWKPGDRDACRRALGISADAKVALFAAADTKNRLKGLQYAAQALGSLSHLPGLLFLTVGWSDPGPVAPGVRNLHLGPIASDALMRIAYGAADAFLMPSLEESFGQAVVESMACGTPVVAFATGGMLDTVRNGRTGFLVTTGNASEFGSAVERVLTDRALHARMSAESRRTATEEYSSDLQAKRYGALYAVMLAAPPVSSPERTADHRVPE